VEIPASDGYKLPTRVYKHKSATSTQDSPLPIFDFIHGGGFLFGTLKTEDYFCVRVVETLYNQGTPCVLVNSIYRHTPDHTFPRVYQDGIDAFEYIATNPKIFLGHDLPEAKSTPRIVVGGISAGGGISTAIAINELERSRAEGDANRVFGAWLTIPIVMSLPEYPAEYIIPGKSSLVQPDCAENVAGLAKATVDYFMDTLVPDPNLLDHKWLSPTLVDPEHLKGFPRCSFQICGADPLRDGALILAQNLKEKGGVDVVDVVVYNGLPHAYWGMNIELDCSKRFYNDTVRVLQKLLSN